MPQGIPERVEILEAKVAEIQGNINEFIDCMKHLHATIETIEEEYRLHGEYSAADKCEVCMGIIKKFPPKYI